MREPNFENMLAVLERKVPKRPTLFEFYMNNHLYETLTGKPAVHPRNSFEELVYLAEAFTRAGYDYVTTHACSMRFVPPQSTHSATISLNAGHHIHSWESFRAFNWPDPESFDYSNLEKITPYLPGNMKVMVMGPSGVLENVISLVGYENLCFMLYEEEKLVQAIFDAVGERLLRYYELATPFDSVGMLISNDDWGFNTQTFLTTEQMKKYVYPWHKKLWRQYTKAESQPCFTLVAILKWQWMRR